MKKFDSFEKEIIETMVSDKNLGRNVLNILDKYLTENSVNIELINGSVNLKFELNTENGESEGINDIVENRLDDIQLKFLKLMNLVNYLEKNGLLITFLDSHQQNANIDFGPNINSDIVGYQFPDPDITELFKRYANKKLLITPDLKELVLNDFVYKDDLRYRKQVRLTWFGITTSIILGLYSIISDVTSNELTVLNKNLIKLNASIKLMSNNQNKKNKLYTKKISRVNDQLGQTIKNQELNNLTLLRLHKLLSNNQNKLNSSKEKIN